MVYASMNAAHYRKRRLSVRTNWILKYREYKHLRYIRSLIAICSADSATILWKYSSIFLVQVVSSEQSFHSEVCTILLDIMVFIKEKKKPLVLNHFLKRNIVFLEKLYWLKNNSNRLHNNLIMIVPKLSAKACQPAQWNLHRLIKWLHFGK